MKLTGEEIVSLIRRTGLEHVECTFSLPKDIYEMRPRKYRKLNESELYDVFKRYTRGEKLIDLAKEYGANPTVLSEENKKRLKKLSKKGTIYNEKQH